jgi:hypothetical protein
LFYPLKFLLYSFRLLFLLGLSVIELIIAQKLP